MSSQNGCARAKQPLPMNVLPGWSSGGSAADGRAAGRGRSRGCRAEKGKLILYLTQTWELDSAVFSEMFEADQRTVETCPPESRGWWRDTRLHAKIVTLKNQQYSCYETFISLCVSALEQG